MWYRKFYQQIAQNEFTSAIGFCEYVRAFDYFSFSDETWFSLDGYINSQNCRVWPCDNPRTNADKFLIGPIFFESGMNSYTYCDIINQVISLLEPDERNIMFRQDGGKPHTPMLTIEFLRSFFGDWLLSNGSLISQKPSTDLIQIDFIITMLRNVFRNFLRWTLTCKHTSGAHFQH